MSEFKTEDVLVVVKEILDKWQPYMHYNNNGLDYATCDYCCGRSTNKKGTIDEELNSFKHDLDCVYTIAKDMITGYEDKNNGIPEEDNP